jgi:hypothetical protein
VRREAAGTIQSGPVKLRANGSLWASEVHAGHPRGGNDVGSWYPLWPDAETVSRQTVGPADEAVWKVMVSTNAAARPAA